MSAHERASESVDWLTPGWVFQALGLTFDLDPCASRSRFGVVPVDRVFGVQWTERGADVEWPKDSVVWLNPPYGRAAEPFLREMGRHAVRGGSGVALIPARTDTRAWHLWVVPWVERGHYLLLFKVGRIRFLRGETGREGPAPAFPSVFVGWGPTGRDAVKRSGIPGWLV